MDFFEIKERIGKKNAIEVYPNFKVCRTKDLMVRGGSFYAIWDEEKGLWSTDEYDVPRLVDRELYSYADKIRTYRDGTITVKSLGSFSSKAWVEFRNYMRCINDNGKDLDTHLTFANTEVKRTDYVSKRLPYPLEPGSYSAYDEIIGTLYEPDEREKIEWAIGSIISGDSRDIQKFLVFYGEAGAGKSTILNIIQKLFDGYCSSFDAKSLASANNAFSTESFRNNPLVAIQHDGDLSKIEDNTKLNSIVSHEKMTVNEKFKSAYDMRINSFLFMATNRPVKITDAKSGIIRRLIDVKPSGKKIPPKRYFTLMSQIDFELGAIASHCLDVYQKLGKNYYYNYKPIDMMLKTDVFFNFVESYFEQFKEEDGVSLARAYTMYKEYCDEALVEFKMPRYKFREELKNYFQTFLDVKKFPDGTRVRSYYDGFISEAFTRIRSKTEEKAPSLVLDCTESIFDKEFASCTAQYANDQETPMSRWSDVKTTLSDLDTSKLHYILLPENHIVIDFDLKDSEGNKSPEMNLEAASKWPPTYAEYSKGGGGVHLHYIYDGDVTKLSNSYSKDIEIKKFTGNSSLRRRLSKCNNIPIATINSGLPVKGEKMINFTSVKSEKSLREQIERNLRKEIHPGTKPSIDFIYKILEDAYSSGLKYDVSDMRQKVMIFANNSTHQSDYCVKLVCKMKFKSEERSESTESYSEDRLVFFDVEVFPNLFLINWKFADDPNNSWTFDEMKFKGNKVVRMINPTPKEVEELFKYKLVGFNCRRYDNHILYARYIGYSNEQLFNLSGRIVNGSKDAMFGEAYNISYTDVYDFSSKKQSLKKFEIELGIHHQELGMPWDQPVPEDMWYKVAEYCDNDVLATEFVFNARKADWTARQILADVAGMTVNDTTNSLTTKIIFQGNRKPQNEFNYRNMGDEGEVLQSLNSFTFEREDADTNVDPFDMEDGFNLFDAANRPIFPGYKFEHGVSTYRGEEVGEGGYVYAEPGIYYDVALLDIASMHPSSIVAEDLFGREYTQRFNDILQARIAIKHGDFDKAKKMLDGKLAPYLNDEGAAKDLAQALKIAINSVYGLTSAKFENPFRDIRNKDNIVAKRGALFMINLKHEVQLRGYRVAHIKTDSIKIPNATPEIIEFVQKYGREYGYNFEHEATYDRMCLVNDAVYIAKYKGGKHDGEWTATGAQFQQPYIFKNLFSHEPIKFEDMCEAKSVSTALYLDLNEGLGEDEHNYQFVGKCGLFCPIISGHGGGLLLREKDGKFYSATGAKGFRWLESETVKLLDISDFIDESYYTNLVDEAIETISQYGSFDAFVSGDRSDGGPPWLPPCGDEKRSSCLDCSKFEDGTCRNGYDLRVPIVTKL